MRWEWYFGICIITFFLLIKFFIFFTFFAAKFAPGVYTLAVSEALPEEMQVGILLFV